MQAVASLIRLLLVTVAVVLTVAATAPGFRLQRPPTPVAGNPVEALAALPADPPEYDAATHCKRTPRAGMTAFRRWLETHAAGVAWGTYRCERWGKRRASLHAEGRAIDWHLDVARPTDRAAARKLITQLLAPDSAGTPAALARRMGIAEIIWDCSYWSAGMPEFRRYSACFNRHGRPRRKVDRTIAHRNHIHFGMTKRGAAARTTFWRYLELRSVSRLRDELAATARPEEVPAEKPDAPAAGDGWDEAEPQDGEDDGW